MLILGIDKASIILADTQLYRHERKLRNLMSKDNLIKILMKKTYKIQNN